MASDAYLHTENDPVPFEKTAVDNLSLRVRCRVRSGTFGSTFSVWVGSRVVLAGWRPTKKRAWRTVSSCLDALNTPTCKENHP